MAFQILSDVVESVLGALFVSEDFSEVGTDAFFHGALRPFFDRHIRMQSLSLHPNIGLYEWFQAEGCQEHEIVKTLEDSQTKCEGESDTRLACTRRLIRNCRQLSSITSYWLVRKTLDLP